MSKITNDGLIRSGTLRFFSYTHMATVGVKGVKTRHLKMLTIFGLPMSVLVKWQG